MTIERTLYHFLWSGRHRVEITSIYLNVNHPHECNYESKKTYYYGAPALPAHLQ